MNLLTIEDRILILQDKVDVLKAGFDSNEPRDERGRWSPSGATARVKGAAKELAGWAGATKVAAAIKANATSENARAVLATTIASVLTSPMNDDAAAESVKQSILHAADGMRVTAEEAREHVVGTLNRLRAMRLKEKKGKPEVAKADDALAAELTKLIELIDNLDLEVNNG